MDNLSRLKLEIKPYFTDDEYKIFLEENGLLSTDEYNKAKDELYLFQTVIAILQALSNNIDLMMSVQTEFSTSSSAYKNLRDRIDELNKRISLIPTYEPQNKMITYLYHN